MHFRKILFLFFCLFQFVACNESKKENHLPRSSQSYDPYRLDSSVPAAGIEKISTHQLKDSLSFFSDSTELERYDLRMGRYTFGIITVNKSKYGYVTNEDSLFFYRRNPDKWELTFSENIFSSWCACKKMDLDQDGYKDLVLGVPGGARGNFYSYVWMWDKTKHELNNISPDKRPGFVRGYFMGGLGGDVKSLYKIYPDSIQLVAECELYTGWVITDRDSIFMTELKEGKLIEKKYVYPIRKAQNILLHKPWYGDGIDPWFE
jgi:hypothetical protein